MQQPPNIAVFILDSVRAQHISCYGYNRNTTPFLDRLAENGIQYENAHANAIWSLPSYASFFTGKYPTQHGAVDWRASVEDNRLVEQLNNRGYDTIGFSPHILPGEYGLAESFSQAELISKPSDPPYSDDPAFDVIESRSYNGRLGTARKYVDAIRLILGKPSPQTVLNKAHAIVRRWRQRLGWWTDSGARTIFKKSRISIKNAEPPFFLFTNFLEPHFRYKPPRKYIYKYVDRKYDIESLNQMTQFELLDTVLGDLHINDNREEVLTALYDACIHYLDDQIHDFYQFLDREGYADNTLIVVLADHGELLGESGWWGHNARIHNRLSHVPLIVYHSKMDSHIESSPIEVRSLCDYLIRCADKGLTASLDTSDVALVEHYGADTGTALGFLDQYDNNAEEYKKYEVAAITNKLKLSWDCEDHVQLHNIRSDPNETYRLSDHEQYDDEIKNLQAEVVSRLDHPQETHDSYREGSRQALDQDAVEHLKDLGYF